MLHFCKARRMHEAYDAVSDPETRLLRKMCFISSNSLFLYSKTARKHCYINTKGNP